MRAATHTGEHAGKWLPTCQIWLSGHLPCTQRSRNTGALPVLTGRIHQYWEGCPSPGHNSCSAFRSLPPVLRQLALPLLLPASNAAAELGSSSTYT